MLPENLKTKFVRSAPVDDDPMSPTSQLFDKQLQGKNLCNFSSEFLKKICFPRKKFAFFQSEKIYSAI